MRKAKTEKLFLVNYGSFLGMEKGCLVVRNKKGKEQKYPLFDDEVGEVIVKSGNSISTGVLASLSFWEIDLVVLTRRGKPIAYLKNVNYDSHAKTRIAQYKAHIGNKGIEIAKQIVFGKIKGQNMVLRKHGLRQHDLMKVKREIENITSETLTHVRKKLLPTEGRYTTQYFNKIFKLFPSWLTPENRKTFQAYDGGNNLFNLAYTVLKWKVHKAILKAHLDAYLGFMHSLKYVLPSLVCDLQDLYRFLVDDFLIEYCQKLKKTDFRAKYQRKKRRIGKRVFLKDRKTEQFVKELYEYFEKIIKIPRIRRGKKQKIDTLISEEVLLFAKYLRGERKTWIPRIATIY